MIFEWLKKKNDVNQGEGPSNGAGEQKKQRFNEINNGNEMQLNELVQFVGLQYIFWIPEVAVNN